MDKEQRKNLLIEIMRDSEEMGLYDGKVHLLSYEETAYLLSTEANRKSLEQGLKEAALIEQGKLKGKTFDDFLDNI